MFRDIRLKIAVAIITTVSVTFFNLAPVYAATFRDISGHWAGESIVRLASMQIVTGYDGRFDPGGAVTRAEFATMMVKAMGLADQAQVVKGSPTGFVDVPSSHWASGFIIIAREMGIISGYPDRTFQPLSRIRRDEITSVLVRALKLAPTDDMKELANAFTDGTDIPGWAADAVKVGYNYGLISGFPGGSFYPARNATRGETAVLIERVLRQYGSEFTFYGHIREINAGSSKITLDIHGQVETFSYRPSLTVSIGGETKKIGSLAAGQGVFVIVDDEGYINFVQASDGAEPDPGPGISGAVAASPGYAKSPSSISGKGTVEALIVTEKGMADRVSRLVQSRGGRINFTDKQIDFIFAEVPGDLFAKLQKDPLVAEVTVDRPVQVNRLSAMAETMNSADTNPGLSLNATKEAIKAPEFVRLTQADGKNQVIAIIDTGIDAGHPDLQQTSDNRRKIVEWRDFTGEGDIDTSSVTEPSGKNLNLANGTYYIGDIRSLAGRFRYGYIREIDMVNADGGGFDLNFNGKENDIFAIILTDTAVKGVYDTVCIDTDGDMDFSDETPLHLFSLTGEFANFTGHEGKDQRNVVLSEIASDYTKVNIGFDGNDHGTHVAGIAAANGRVKGVAPGAQLMSLKVLDTGGYGDLSAITKAMTFAAAKGAKIINLSLGFPASDTNGGSVPAKLLNNLTEEYGVIFVVAAGNNGPGMSTVATPGDASAALSVGAFITPEMWKTDYGWDVPGENLWFFSSTGPRRDGAISPSVVAPGSAVSTISMHDGKQYVLSEGTSMAAPHVAGAMALLMEVVQRNKLNLSPVIIKRAVEVSARAIPNYEAAEQGYGALNLPMAWAEIMSLRSVPYVSVQTLNPGGSLGRGIFFREGQPGQLTLYLKNNSHNTRTLRLDSGIWITPGQETVNIPAGATRAVDVKINLPQRKGLMSTFISGEDYQAYGRDMEALATVINPYELPADSGYSVSIDDEEKPAQYKRYFFRVPPGAQALKARLAVPAGMGRSRVFLFDPEGRQVSETEFAGTNPGGTTAEVVAVGNNPSAGVWEIVVYSSAGLSAYNLNKSAYNLTVFLEGVNSPDLQPENRGVIIGVLPKILKVGRVNYITVQVRDRYTKRPYQGFIEIDGQIYYTRGGKATLPVETAGNDINMVVRTVAASPLLQPWKLDFTFSAGPGIFQ